MSRGCLQKIKMTLDPFLNLEFQSKISPCSERFPSYRPTQQPTSGTEYCTLAPSCVDGQMLIDFELPGLSSGAVMQNQYRGVRISAESNGQHDVAMIFDTRRRPTVLHSFHRHSQLSSSSLPSRHLSLYLVFCSSPLASTQALFFRFSIRS